MATLNNVPGTPEVWLIDGKSYVVYTYDLPGLTKPGTFGGVPVAWEIKNDKDLEALFGPGQTPAYDKRLSEANFLKHGTVVMGNADRLANFTKDPLETWVENVGREMEVRPWLRDPEVAGISLAALLEGRDLTEAEMQQTDWWRSHNDAQRKWMLLSESDPATAAQIRRDTRLALNDAFKEAGASGVPQEVRSWMADQLAQGNWTDTYLSAQIRAVADPQAKIKMDKELQAQLKGVEVGTTIDQENVVRDMAREWLGPKFGEMSEGAIERWAGVLRNDPNGRERLEEQLQGQRVSLFPEYEDRSLTYEQIAQPWRNLWTQEWGQQADESDPLFAKIVRSNDAMEAAQLLRRHGIDRGVEAVWRNLESDLGSTFSTVRGG